MEQLLKILSNRILEEYDQFEKDMLLRTKKEIFDGCYKIRFMWNMTDILSECDIMEAYFDEDLIVFFAEFEGNILQTLFSIENHYDEPRGTFEGHIDFIRECYKILCEQELSKGDK